MVTHVLERWWHRSLFALTKETLCRLSISISGTFCAVDFNEQFFFMYIKFRCNMLRLVRVQRKIYLLISDLWIYILLLMKRLSINKRRGDGAAEGAEETLAISWFILWDNGFVEPIIIGILMCIDCETFRLGGSLFVLIITQATILIVISVLSPRTLFSDSIIKCWICGEFECEAVEYWTPNGK